MSSDDKISRREFLERTSLAVGAVAAVPALAGVGPVEAAVTIPRRTHRGQHGLERNSADLVGAVADLVVGHSSCAIFGLMLLQSLMLKT